MRAVLLVDDDADLLRRAAAQFLASGYQVVIAGDGEAAIAKLKTTTFDLVITDIVMPVRDGVEVIIATRKLSPRTKIIAVTGGYRANPEDFMRMAKYLGADETIAKPCPPSVLVEAAASLLSGEAERGHGEASMIVGAA